MKYKTGDVVWCKAIRGKGDFAAVVTAVDPKYYNVRAYDGTEWQRRESELGKE